MEQSRAFHNPQDEFWERRHLPDYLYLRKRLPLREAHLTQVAPGPYEVSAKLVWVADIGVTSTFISGPSVGYMVQRHDQIVCIIPLSWTGDMKVNGTRAAPCRIHLADREDSFHIVGEYRNSLAVSVSRERFVKTVSALLGPGHGENIQLSGSLDVPQAVFARLQQVLLKSLGDGPRICEGHPIHALRLSDEIIDALTNACLAGCQVYGTPAASQRASGRIVRAAENRFAQALDYRVSLADLCEAADVSKTALYEAFHDYCDVSPLAYFHKRKMALARSILINSPLDRGSVKRAALGAGLTELGRFSVEYRELFGESPSATLSNRF